MTATRRPAAAVWVRIILLGVSVFLTTVAPRGSTAHSEHRGGVTQCPCCIRPRKAAKLAHKRASQPAAPPQGLALVGFCPLPGFNADVWAHGSYVYVGSEGQGKQAGVAVVHVANPAAPRLVGRIAAIRNTTQEDVMVRRITTPTFTGDLLVTGIQARDARTRSVRGVDLWDVTRPERPRHLAFWSSGSANKPSPARGVHELFLFQQGPRAFVAAMVPDAEEYDEQGDFRLVDVSDPTRPRLAGTWSAFRDGGLPDLADQYPWGHSVSVNRAGTLAIASFWKAGTIFLDISDPAHPRMVRRIVEATGPVGRTHSVWLSEDESLMLAQNENLQPLAGAEPWGFLRLWDIGSGSAPTLLSTFATPNARVLPPRRDGIYSVHNSVIQGNTAFLSWFSDGVRAVDFSDPRSPREVGSFVPSGADIWGIHAAGELIFASDIRSGLYVLRLTASPPAF